MAADENGPFQRDFQMSPIVELMYSDTAIDLDDSIQRNARIRYEGDCENAIAQLPPGVVDYMLGLFHRIAPSSLPAPLWHSRSFRDGNSADSGSIVSKSFRLAIAARLALAADEDLQEAPLKAKVDRVYEMAKTYLDSVARYENVADLESILLLAELEYGRGQNIAAQTRLQRVIATLGEVSKVQTSYIFDHDERILRMRPVLQTALLMLYWYFGDVPSSISTKISPTIHTHDLDSEVSMTECFATAQLQLACLHVQKENYLKSLPEADDYARKACDHSVQSCFNGLQTHLKESEARFQDQSVTFFIFGQQYLCARINLLKNLEPATRRSRGLHKSTTLNGFPSLEHDTANLATKVASSLKSFGERYRFREAPLSFVRHIRTAAGVLLEQVKHTAPEDFDDYLKPLSFLCDVLRYMSEVHEQARILLETLEQQMNSLLLPSPSIGDASENVWNGFTLPSRSGTPAQGRKFLPSWSREGSRDSSRHREAARASRPQSSAGIPPVPSMRPKLPRSISTPSEVPSQNPDSVKGADRTVALLSPKFVPKHQSPQRHAITEVAGVKSGLRKK